MVPKVEPKDDNVMIDGKIFLDQPVKSDLRTYYIIQKITADQRDLYFKEHYEMIAIDLSKEQVLDADQKAIQKINVMRNLEVNAQ